MPKMLVFCVHQMGLGGVEKLVDLKRRCVTDAHPDAEEASVDGGIHEGTLTVHVNITHIGLNKVSG